MADKLKCAICKYPLSVPPIVVCNDLGAICGRNSCHEISRSKETRRQDIYEIIAETLIFPCMNEEHGCKAILHWKDVEEHEHLCEFVKTNCPFSSQWYAIGKPCKWRDNISKLLKHMEVEHAGSRFGDLVEIDLKDDFKKNKIFFTNIVDDILIVLAMVDTKLDSYWKVWSGSKVHGVLKHKMEIFTKTEKKVVSSKMLLTDLIKPNFFKDAFDDTWFKVQYHNFRNFFETPKFFIISFYIDEIIVLEPKVQFDQEPIRDMIECVNCKHEVRNTLYVCRNKKSHPHCLSCKEMTDSCFVCKTDLCFNTSFNQMALIGNKYICKVCQDTVHCLPSHFIHKHPGLIDQSITRDIEFQKRFKRSHEHFFSYDNHIFSFHHQVKSNGDVQFLVMCLGTYFIKYKFTLHLWNWKNPHTFLKLSNMCTPELMNVSDDSSYMSVPVDLLVKLFPDIDLTTFRVTIKEIE